MLCFPSLFRPSLFRSLQTTHKEKNQQSGIPTSYGRFEHDLHHGTLPFSLFLFRFSFTSVSFWLVSKSYFITARDYRFSTLSPLAREAGRPWGLAKLPRRNSQVVRKVTNGTGEELKKYPEKNLQNRVLSPSPKREKQKNKIKNSNGYIGGKSSPKNKKPNPAKQQQKNEKGYCLSHGVAGVSGILGLKRYVAQELKKKRQDHGQKWSGRGRLTTAAKSINQKVSIQSSSAADVDGGWW
ncbi:hypothetical protein B0T26DRAFT_203323 [Lasiosphaeria miniovina]|uniref:Uncharacterized protein n=1 Tax=Lasiosphaeria miniovina TaxID=1954250 RepID=A0AA40AUE8_9PEZI|nr:uncharacterized protein B0T26DRAFT_203323 [Lasiosphaeria miniovina]KAK0722114.1 hypothetical protein B0T26DRAFT_203323 [Lasiosphaeria miniovina]